MAAGLGGRGGGRTMIVLMREISGVRLNAMLPVLVNGFVVGFAVRGWAESEGGVAGSGFDLWAVGQEEGGSLSGLARWKGQRYECGLG